MKSKFRALMVFLLFLGLGLYLSLKAPAWLEAQESPQVPGKSYPQSGVETGVFNDGQAALWDLNVTDHFHVFGPQERAKGFRPTQPINFSHVIHVQQNKIECQFCHWSVGKAAYAAIPEVQTCMSCHQLIPGKNEKVDHGGGAYVPSEEIKKIADFWAKAEPIPWVKVHVMPDHVKFNHRRHVKAGMSCQECHGQIPEMPVVQRVSSMKMGWCVDCHRQRGTSIDCYTCHR